MCLTASRGGAPAPRSSPPTRSWPSSLVPCSVQGPPGQGSHAVCYRQGPEAWSPPCCVGSPSKGTASAASWPLLPPSRVSGLGGFWGSVGGWAGGGHQEEGGDVTGLTSCDFREWTARRGPRRGGQGRRSQMMLGTLPLLLFRLLFFRDRLGVAMSTKRSSGQPYCSSTSVHSWLEACRA